MALKSRTDRQTDGYNGGDGERSESNQTSQRILMPREYYDIKHPWFGSQIHYTIDVFRQLISDARARKQHSSNDGC